MTVLAGCQLHELSMEAVAEAAGVGKPVLYTAFSTRTELVSALLRREHQRGLEQILAGMPDDLTEPARPGPMPRRSRPSCVWFWRIPLAGGSS